MRQWITGLLVISIGFGAFLLGGCENETQNKALWGTAIGAGVGQLVGGDTKATMIGAGIGAGTGAAIGHSQDKKKEQQQQQQTQAAQQQAQIQRADANVVTIWVTNSNGSKTPVKLTRTATGGYIGPKGELYDTMPTAEQLLSVYGF